jgi:hypothetical protein
MAAFPQTLWLTRHPIGAQNCFRQFIHIAHAIKLLDRRPRGSAI